jgi:Domain of unknown function (DUF1877)
MGMRLTVVMVRAEELDRLARDPSELLQLLLHGSPDSRLTMDKEWHGIHYLLTGEPWPVDHPLGRVIFGADDIGDNLGYGPARTLTVEQVLQIATQLSQTTAEDLRGRYDVGAMTEAMIYPEVWQREGTAALDWLLVGYQRLVRFYTEASSKGYAVVLAIL